MIAIQTAFSLDFADAQEPYTLHFEPSSRSNGDVVVQISGMQMRWAVETVSVEVDGTLTLCGMTQGSLPLWGDQFWFELRIEGPRASIGYWHDRVLWREDVSTGRASRR